MVEVRTSQYQFVHGRKPAGRGHWVFYMDNCAMNCDPNSMFFSGRRQLYSEALKDAMYYAKQHGHTVVTVGS